MFKLTHHEYQCCHKQHLLRVPDTRNIERIGTALVATPSSVTILSLLDFIEEVCKWGGRTGYRVFGKIAKVDRKLIESSFMKAIAAIKAGDTLKAKDELKPISGLGQFSYSSKHIRMLAPHLSGVLDSIIESYLKASYETHKQAKLYIDYCAFCIKKAKDLTSARVKKGDHLSTNLCEINGQEPELGSVSESHWLAADVDMACFSWLQGWCFAGATRPALLSKPKQRRNRNNKMVASDVIERKFKEVLNNEQR